MPVIASWNVNSLRARLDHVTTWLATSPVDILAVQETKVQDHEFPAAEIAALGYTCRISGQKTYNGVAVLTREPQTLIATAIPGFDDPQCRVLAVAVGELCVLNLYVPNGSEVDSDKYAYKLAWLDAVHIWVGELLRDYPQLVVLGDFNIAPADADVHDPDAWRDRILCSEPERQRLRALLELGLVDTYRQFEQAAHSFSWWDYRGGGYRRNHGLRIDLVLASVDLAGRLSASYIDGTPRGWEKPSDHAPVVAQFDT